VKSISELVVRLMFLNLKLAAGIVLALTSHVQILFLTIQIMNIKPGKDLKLAT
jgi:hypothetical protein